MKKLVSLLLLIAMSLTFSAVAFAEKSTRYRIEEIGLSVAIPDGLFVFTRDTRYDDPGLSTLGLTKDQLLSTFRNNNIYLDAIPEDVSYEIIITIVDNPINDFNAISDSMLLMLLESLQSEFENYGLQVSSIEVYQHPQAKFGLLQYSKAENGGTTYSYQYYTVYNGKAINFTLHSYSGKVNSTMSLQLKWIVDNAQFDGEALSTPEPEKTADFPYTDTETGTSFTVPAGWKQTPLSKERDYFDVKFVSTVDPGMSILYGSTDLWNEMSSSEKEGLTRAVIDNSFFSISDLEEAFGFSTGTGQKVEFGGNPYYLFHASTSDYGLTVPITWAIHIDDGYLYMFMFSGSKDNALYGDFQLLMNSVCYPGGSDSPSGGSDSPSYERANKSTSSTDNNSKLLVISLSVVFVAIIAAGYLCFFRKKAKTRTVTDHRPPYAPPLTTNAAYAMNTTQIHQDDNGAPEGKRTNSEHISELELTSPVIDPPALKSPIHKHLISESPAQKPSKINQLDLRACVSNPKLRRVFLFAEGQEWDRADDYLETILDEEPENAYAYLGKLLIELKLESINQLVLHADKVKNSRNYIKALRFSDGELKGYLESIVHSTDFRE